MNKSKESIESKNSSLAIFFKQVAEKSIGKMELNLSGTSKPPSMTPSEEDQILMSSQETVKDEENYIPTPAPYVPPKMPTNQKKKYAFFIRNGLQPEEAYEKSKIKLQGRTYNAGNVESTKSKKRNRSDGSLSPGEAKKKHKDASGNPASMSRFRPNRFSDKIKAVNIGIGYKAPSTAKLTAEDVQKIQRGVERAILGQKDSTIKPKFTQLPYLKSGWMIFCCVDRITADWLKNLAIWNDWQCVALEENELPSAHTVVGYFQGSKEKSSEEIIGMVQGQNGQLSTAEWVTVSRTEIKSCVVLVLEIDAASMQQIQKMGRRVDYGFGQKVKLLPRIDQEAPQNGKVKKRAAPNRNTQAADCSPSPATSTSHEQESMDITVIDNSPQIEDEGCKTDFVATAKGASAVSAMTNKVDGNLQQPNASFSQKKGPNTFSEAKSSTPAKSTGHHANPVANPKMNISAKGNKNSRGTIAIKK